MTPQKIKINHDEKTLAASFEAIKILTIGYNYESDAVDDIKE